MSTNAASRPLACITGASSGIGTAFAYRLAREGYDLILVARRTDRLENLRAQIQAESGIRGEVFPTDLNNPEDLHRLEAYLQAADRLEMLVNNAGFGLKGTFAEISVGEHQRMLDVHILATMRLTRAALPGLLRRGKGAIINVSSLGAFLNTPGSVEYCATKAYLNTFSETLSIELRATGVKIQALCPGFTRSEFHQTMGIDRRRIKGMRWMSAEAVVDSSLAALLRDQVIHVPGLQNNLILWLTRLVPRPLYRSIVSKVNRNWE